MTPEQLAELFVEDECDNTSDIHTQIEILLKKAFKAGYNCAVDKACEWLRENIYHRVYECGDRLGYPTADFLKDFRKAMEE